MGKMDVGLYSPANYKSWRKTKALKDMESKCIFVRGRDIYMDKVESLCSRELVGHLEYCKIGKEEWVVWETQHRKSLLDYVPIVSRIENGLLVFFS